VRVSFLISGNDSYEKDLNEKMLWRKSDAQPADKETSSELSKAAIRYLGWDERAKLARKRLDRA
jgi:hypothetical protein